MKKVFFYSNHREYDQTIGITQKVHGEISAIQSLGYNVTYSAYIENGAAVYDNEGKMLFNKCFKIHNSFLRRVLRRWILINCCLEFLEKENTKYDFAYLRFHFFDNSYNRLLKSFKKSGCFTIVEAHVFPYRIWKNVELWPTYILDILYTPIVKHKIDMVSIMGKCEKPWGIKSVQIDNGIDLDKYPKQKKIKSPQIRLISVSNEHNGHAYYKVINGLANYYKNGGKEDIVINFVGEYMDSTKKLIQENGLENRIKFWGKMCGNELDDVFNKSDLGLGAFSHRKNDTGSCIKTKEYFARGIPFINGWKELAFDDSYPYVLRFDTSDETIDFFKVVEFYHKLEENSSVGETMRSFAEQNYTWISQMKKVFEKAEALL